MKLSLDLTQISQYFRDVDQPVITSVLQKLLHEQTDPTMLVQACIISHSDTKILSPLSVLYANTLHTLTTINYITGYKLTTQSHLIQQDDPSPSTLIYAMDEIYNTIRNDTDTHHI